jgi:hypothetical protein
MSFDEDDLGPLPHLRCAPDGFLDVAGLVASGNDD